MKKFLIMMSCILFLTSCFSLPIKKNKGYIAFEIDTPLTIILINSSGKKFKLFRGYQHSMKLKVGFVAQNAPSSRIVALPEGEYFIHKIIAPILEKYELETDELETDNFEPIHIKEGVMTYLGNFHMSYEKKSEGNISAKLDYSYNTDLAWLKFYRGWGNELKVHAFKGYLDIENP